MIVKEVEVLNTMPCGFTDKEGNRVQFFQVSARDSEKMYLLNSKRDYNIGDIIDICYDSTRKRYSIVEFEERSK